MYRPTVFLLIASFVFTFTGCDQTPSSKAPYQVAELLKSKGYDVALQEVQRQLDKKPKSRFLLEQKMILLLSNPSPKARVEAIATQRQLDAIGAGRQLLKDQANNRLVVVRQQTASILGILGDKGGVEVLKKLAEDRGDDVRAEAIHALARVNDPSAKSLLMIRLRDGYWKVRAEAADALAKLKDPTATKQLFRAVDDADDYARMQILSAVLTLADPSQEAIYRKEIQSDTVSRKTAAALALGKIDHPEATPILLELLANQSSDEHLQLALCLVKIAPDSTVPEIARLHKNERNPQVKEVLANYLRERTEAKKQL